MALDHRGKRYFENTRYAFPKMVELFQRYDVHVTWAVVGMLYNRDATAWRRNIPNLQPTYVNPLLSAYAWADTHGLAEPEDPYHFAPDLISLIENDPRFEIGTHTYGHYYCKEPGQTLPQFKDDLEKAVHIAAERGHHMRSLVFPRNQFNEDYLRVCTACGITSVRSNPSAWYWDANRPDDLTKKVFRTGDAYTSMLGHKVVPFEAIDASQQPLQLPASRLYRGWTRKSSLLNRLKMQRILQEMEMAARKSAYYHLWWHPHNFGHHPDQCLAELETILQHFHHWHRTQGMWSLTMDETRNYLQGRPA